MRFLISVLTLLAAETAFCDAQSTAAQSSESGAVAGKVSAEGGKALPPMVIYLKAVDESRSFSPPSRPGVISQNGATFSPALLVVCVGQSVEFKNDETRQIEHNVFSQSPAKPFDLGLYPPPESRSVAFDKPGPVRLFCSIHRYMDGMIFVSPTPFFAQPEKDGSFKIDNVPPGEYRLITWQKNARYKELDIAVKVEAGKPVTANLEMSRK